MFRFPTDAAAQFPALETIILLSLLNWRPDSWTWWAGWVWSANNNRKMVFNFLPACFGKSTSTRWRCGFGYRPIFWSRGLSILRQPTKLVQKSTLLAACSSRDTLLKRSPWIIQQDVKSYAVTMSDAKATITSLANIFASWTIGRKKPGLKTSKTIRRDSIWRADLVEVFASQAIWGDEKKNIRFIAYSGL